METHEHDYGLNYHGDDLGIRIQKDIEKVKLDYQYLKDNQDKDKVKVANVKLEIQCIEEDLKKLKKRYNIQASEADQKSTQEKIDQREESLGAKNNKLRELYDNIKKRKPALDSKEKIILEIDPLSHSESEYKQ